MINKTPKAYNLNNLLSDYVRYLSSVIHLSPVSVKNYVSDIRHFIGWLMTDKKSLSTTEPDHSHIFTLITKKAVMHYRSNLLTSNLPVKTINRRLSSLRKFCSFGIAQGWTDNNPAKKVPNVKSNYSRQSEKSIQEPQIDRRSDSRIDNKLIREFKTFTQSHHISIDKSTYDDISEFISYLDDQNLISSH